MNFNNKFFNNGLNISILIFLGFISYKFFYDLNLYGFITLLFFYFTSLLISIYVLDNFKYSQNIYIKYLQKYIIFIFLILLIFFIIDLIFPNLFNVFAYGPDNDNINNNNSNNSKDLLNIKNTNENESEYVTVKIYKETLNEALNVVSDAAKFSSEKIIPNIGVGTATGAMIKATTGLPPMQRAGAIAGTFFITACATKVGIHTGSLIARKFKYE
jgi:hypothetical protein